ncbi:MAG TPA: nucleotidyltransferase [Bacteriovoracaceae bacterium]|nr:nucleotidyltransferase [Bacteriovoracaceae bacterium]
MPHKKSRIQEIEQANRDFHDHNLTELSTLNRTLQAAIEAVESNHIPYALIGGVAVKELGRPRVTHDIDLFVQPDDAEKVLEVLQEKGFHVERRDPLWLYKAWREEVLVDIIFKSSGDIYFDEQVRANVRRIPYQGRYINAISPEDFIVIKAAAHQEDNPHHWHDALAVITQGNLDWEYLLKRAKHSPRRVLSILIYAQSNDIAVPTEIIQKLYRLIFEHQTYSPAPVIHPYRHHDVIKHESDHHEKESHIYTKGRIMEALTTDERIAEHDIKVIVTGDAVVAKGEVFTDEQRCAVDEVINKIAPHCDVKNQVNVRVLTPPEGSEAIS